MVSFKRKINRSNCTIYYIYLFVHRNMLINKIYNTVSLISRIRCRHKFLVYTFKFCTVIWVIFIIYIFKKFIVLSYGTTHLSAKEVLKLRWKDTWDFIIHKT